MNEKFHEVQLIRAEEEYLRLKIDGISYRIPWRLCSKRLEQASPAQRKIFEVSPSGYGIHWPEIDEDLAITPLISQEGVFEVLKVK